MPSCSKNELELLHGHRDEALHGHLRRSGERPPYRTCVRETRGSNRRHDRSLEETRHTLAVDADRRHREPRSHGKRGRRGTRRVVERGSSSRSRAGAREHGGSPRRPGSTLVPTLADVVVEADVVLSIAPPEAARAIAGDLAGAARHTSARPLVADLNAISPETAQVVAQDLAGAGLELVDGSISGPPPWKPGTRIYLSGSRAHEIAELPLDGRRSNRRRDGDRHGVGGEDEHGVRVQGHVRAARSRPRSSARANGVLEHVLDDLRAGSPELVAQRRAAARERDLEVRPLRRRDGRDRRDAGGRGPDAGALRGDGRRLHGARPRASSAARPRRTSHRTSHSRTCSRRLTRRQEDR